MREIMAKRQDWLTRVPRGAVLAAELLPHFLPRQKEPVQRPPPRTVRRPFVHNRRLTLEMRRALYLLRYGKLESGLPPRCSLATIARDLRLPPASVRVAILKLGKELRGEATKPDLRKQRKVTPALIDWLCDADRL